MRRLLQQKASLHRRLAGVALAIAAHWAAGSATAADIVLSPPSGGGVAVTNAAGTVIRMRVQDDGAFSLPGLAASVGPATGLCVNPGDGRVGTCTVGTVTRIETGAGLTGGPIGTMGTIGLAPTQLLPLEGCAKRQLAEWSGSAWTCATNLTLDASTASSGIVFKGTARFIHDFGPDSTYLGVGAGNNTSAAFTTGGNTGVGHSVLAVSSGERNTGAGARALAGNTTGGSNTALGYEALAANTTGVSNTAIGHNTLRGNTLGGSNVAIGNNALSSSNGVGNIAVGDFAGGTLFEGDFNVYIGNNGPVSGFESNTQRIGDTFQQRTFIAGIRGRTTGAADAVPVMIDSNGQLGTASSSRQVKEEIADMGEASAPLMRLRPVTFVYSAHARDGRAARQFGLVAEEVAEVAPELVAHSADGRIETVAYHFLAPMLLNEVQRQQREIADLRREVERLARLVERGQVARAHGVPRGDAP